METVISNNEAFISSLLIQMEHHLEQTGLAQSDPLDRSRASIKIVRNALDQLKGFTLEQGFPCIQEEIRFFRETKPRFVSQLIYHCRFYQVQYSKPLFRNRLMEEYLMKQMTRIEYFFHKHREFYQYIRDNQNQMDGQYFVRGSEDTFLSLDNYFFNADTRFSTGYDYLVSCIIAYERLGNWLSAELQELPQHHAPRQQPLGKLKWTGSKAALVELIYSLQSSGVFNQATADIKQIASHFEFLFQVDLGGYYRTFQELRFRKKNRTAFLDQLKDNLVRRMEETDAAFEAR
ncbi:MAG TPA: RteC domain-containing protein [Chitinophagaceae bacterium]|nr:RteC domain-containing protein [Chitinophagaceae bacterium]